MTGGGVDLGLGAVEVLIEIEEVEQVELSFELRVLLIQFDEISGGAGAVFLNKADVVLLLELKHFVFAVAQIFFCLDELLGNASRNLAATAFAQPAFEIEILLHDRIQIGLGVIRRASDRRDIKNRGAGFLPDRDLHRHGLQFRMRRTNERFGAVPNFRALDQLNLRAVEVDLVFAVNRPLRNVHLPGHHHLAGGEISGRALVNQKGLDEETEADS